MKLSKIVSKLEERGLYRTAENVKKIVGQDLNSLVDFKGELEDFVSDLVAQLSYEGNIPTIKNEIEFIFEEADAFRSKEYKQFLKANNSLKRALMEYGKLIVMAKRL